MAFRLDLSEVTSIHGRLLTCQFSMAARGSSDVDMSEANEGSVRPSQDRGSSSDAFTLRKPDLDAIESRLEDVRDYVEACEFLITKLRSVQGYHCSCSRTLLEGLNTSAVRMLNVKMILEVMWEQVQPSTAPGARVDPSDDDGDDAAAGPPYTNPVTAAFLPTVHDVPMETLMDGPVDDVDTSHVPRTPEACSTLPMLPLEDVETHDDAFRNIFPSEEEESVLDGGESVVPDPLVPALNHEQYTFDDERSVDDESQPHDA